MPYVAPLKLQDLLKGRKVEWLGRRVIMCEHPEHKGRLRVLKLSEIYIQPFRFNEEEWELLRKNPDYFRRLPMPRILCPACAERELKRFTSNQT